MKSITRLKRDLGDYYLEATRIRPETPADWRVLCAAFQPWRRTSRGSQTPLQAGLPWLTYPAIWFLRRVIGRGSRVFEFGSGGSTLFFARLGAEVTSVEHDPKWRDAVERALAAEGLYSGQLLLKEPTRPASEGSADPTDPNAYVSSDHRYEGLEFVDYATAIDAFPPEHFDLVVIDGRARPSCFAHSVDRVKKGGFLLLDNAEREGYRIIHEELEARGWQVRHFAGPGPFERRFWSTVVWRKS